MALTIGTGWVYGRVIDESGQPIPFVDLVCPYLINADLSIAKTLPNGYYITQIPFASSVTLRAVADGYVTAEVSNLSITPLSLTEVNFRLQPIETRPMNAITMPESTQVEATVEQMPVTPTVITPPTPSYRRHVRVTVKVTNSLTSFYPAKWQVLFSAGDKYITGYTDNNGKCTFVLEEATYVRVRLAKGDFSGMWSEKVYLDPMDQNPYEFFLDISDSRPYVSWIVKENGTVRANHEVLVLTCYGQPVETLKTNQNGEVRAGGVQGYPIKLSTKNSSGQLRVSDALEPPSVMQTIFDIA